MANFKNFSTPNTEKGFREVIVQVRYKWHDSTRKAIVWIPFSVSDTDGYVRARALLMMNRLLRETMERKF